MRGIESMMAGIAGVCEVAAVGNWVAASVAAVLPPYEMSTETAIIFVVEKHSINTESPKKEQAYSPAKREKKTRGQPQEAKHDKAIAGKRFFHFHGGEGVGHP